MKYSPVTVIETPTFIRDAKRLLEESEKDEIVLFLAQNPTVGDVIQGTGGIRKVRYARSGGGKRSGFRIIYFFYSAEIPLFVLNIFAKNEKSNLSQAERNEMRELSSLLVKKFKGERK